MMFVMVKLDDMEYVKDICDWDWDFVSSGMFIVNVVLGMGRSMTVNCMNRMKNM